ncbi:Ornithine carbamoyltransferase [hydrothermal vent metagenome]|uniref:ornithine carbamoyltransferase n=1 Tax=hydrothermal vent metagenome TaxID=652676 RepID=A0A3B1CS35_9ZZZZ
MKRDFLRLWDFSSEEINSIVERAIDLKAGADANRCPLTGKSMWLLFEKPSTRTRISFEVGIYQLGGQSIYMKPSEIQIGRGESTADTARVLSRYLNGIIIRTFEHTKLEEFAANSDVPVINGLSDLHHPCQVLADLMTIKEKKGELEGIKVAYIGDGNNVANSLMEAAGRMGLVLNIACPEGYEPDLDILEQARSGKGEIIVLRDPKEAAGRADVIYTDVWVSMGQEDSAEKKRSKFSAYQVNSSLLACAKKDVIVMHCLPAHRGEEITDEVIDGPQSVVFDQAENRLHTQKALLEILIK